MNYRAMRIQRVHLAFSNVANSHRNGSGTHQREWPWPTQISVPYLDVSIRRSVQRTLCQFSPENGPLPDAHSMKCAGFLVSTYSKLCHLANVGPNNPAALPEWATITAATRSERRPFVRNDVLQWRLTDKRRTKKLENRPIATDFIALTSKVAAKENSGSNAAQFCD